jgi:hypothetical protein
MCKWLNRATTEVRVRRTGISRRNHLCRFRLPNADSVC